MTLPTINSVDQEIEELITQNSGSYSSFALKLFQRRGGLSKHQTTNTISFYDTMPKYARAMSEPYKVEGSDETVRVYSFYHEGVDYIIEVEAARIMTRDGEVEYHFPSTKEELIEDILRHILSTEDQMSFFDTDDVGCQFTIYRIREELKKVDKARSNADVRLSLKILQKARVSVWRSDLYESGSGDTIFSGPYFNDATIIDQNRYFNRKDLPDDESLKGIVKFHNMVSMGIAQCDFRLLRYDICMNYKSEMARWFHKKISHEHRGADHNTPYKILMTTVFNDGNWKYQKRNDKNKDKVNSALKEMMDARQLNPDKKPSIEKIKTQSGTVDFIITIYLSKEFINHIIMSNATSSDTRTYQQAYKTKDARLIDQKEESDVVQRLQKLKIHTKKARALDADYSEDVINANIIYSISYMNKKQLSDPSETFDLPAFIVQSIQNDWAENKSEYPKSTAESNRTTEKSASGSQTAFDRLTDRTWADGIEILEAE